MEKYVLKTEFDPFKKEMYVFKQEMLEFKKETNNRLDKIEEILYINTKQIQKLTVKVDKLSDEIVKVNLRLDTEMKKINDRLDTEMKKINDRLDNELGQLNLNIAEISSKLDKLEL